MSATNLASLLHDVLATEIHDDTTTRADVLLSVLRKNHYWPALQMKKFFDRSGLVLLHNTYKRTDVSAFQELYDECRSVVLDLDAPEGQNIVVSLAHSIPERLTVEAYKARMQDTDMCEEGHEGTVVYVYNHNGKWYFGTSGCPSVDSSRYFHPTKTHGQMVDEIIGDRDAFTAALDPTKTYAFVLVHRDNSHIMKYEVDKLIHIGTRDRATMQEDDVDVAVSRPLADLPGVAYTRKFETPEAAVEALGPATYCLIVRTADGKMYKVSAESVVQREECDLGNPNKWVNMLHVYRQNNPTYHVTDYIQQYAPDLEIPKNSRGRDMAPTYIIHTVFCTMRDILYGHYVDTTSYDMATVRFRMARDRDAALPPIIRFHLAQLRHIQVTSHAHAYLSPKAVYHYLCFHQTINNLRTLIGFFASNGGAVMTFNQAECFTVLHQMLMQTETQRV